MVSVLSDTSKARILKRRLREFLEQDMQLPLKEKKGSQADVELFSALLGLHRCSNPLYPQKKARKELRVVCPLTVRFPTTLPGRLLHYEDVAVSVKEIVDKDGAKVDVHKMWRLVLWIWLGNGGHQHRPWHYLKTIAEVGQRYRADGRQPLEVLNWAIQAVVATGSLMQVIGGDGLDKKSRLGTGRILYLCEWHAAVPGLVSAFHAGPESFSTKVRSLPGFKGDLSAKEIMILLSASSHASIRKVAYPLPFGQGARNGARAFLGIKQMSGKDSHRCYCEMLEEKIPEMEKCMARLFPSLTLRKVTTGDIEPCLCGAFVYAKLLGQLRSSLLETGSRPFSWKDGVSWAAVAKLGVPAGYIPHDVNGHRDAAAEPVKLPVIPYRKFKLAAVPSKEKLTKKKMFAMWAGVAGNAFLKKMAKQRCKKSRKGKSMSNAKAAASKAAVKKLAVKPKTSAMKDLQKLKEQQDEIEAKIGLLPEATPDAKTEKSLCLLFDGFWKYLLRRGLKKTTAKVYLNCFRSLFMRDFRSYEASAGEEYKALIKASPQNKHAHGIAHAAVAHFRSFYQVCKCGHK